MCPIEGTEWAGYGFHRTVGNLDEISVRVDTIIERGARRELLALLALLAGRFAVAKERARELREASGARTDRVLTVAEAAAEYPVSRSFLYERGQALGFVRRTSTGKVTVIERALREYLEGKR